MRSPSPIRRPRLIAGTTLAALVSVALSTLSPAAAQEPGPDRWDVPLVVDGDEVNIAAAAGSIGLASTDGRATMPASAEVDRPQGQFTAAPHVLPAPADRLLVDLDVDLPMGARVASDVRGQRPDDSWTEWVPVRGADPVVLDETVDTVQVRLTLSAPATMAGPSVRGLRVTSDLAGSGVAATVTTSRSAQPLTYRVFATREGLVGGTTANGHVIRERDHFVALPSRRGLAKRGTGDYTVRVCADNGRCEWAPVWDVGPWNITDDNWSPGSVRQSWTDLPQGLPQAQAAFQNGYNGGRDGYGRKVANPAGIDLGDGTFWDGLRLRDNAWVDVAYLWTGTGLVGTVRHRLLNVRAAPTAASEQVGVAAEHAELILECSVVGTTAAGSQGVTDRWLRIGPNQWVSAAHVATAPAVPDC